MVVYIEYAILDNFTMDFFLLFLAAVTLKLPFRRFRIAIASAIGTAFALASANIAGAWRYAANALCLFLMCVTAVGFGKQLFWYILLTLAYTFVAGGAIVGIFNMLNVPYVSQNGLCYQMPVPLFVYFLGMSLVAFLCYSLHMFVKQTSQTASHMKKVRIVLGNKTFFVTGFCDSGNTARCDDIPVCFVTKNFGNVRQYFAAQTLRGQSRQVQVSTLVGSRILPAVKAQILIDGTSSEIFLSLPAEKCKTRYELLLNACFCG